MPLVFIESYRKNFYSEYCSLSFFITFLFSLLVILLPFFACNSTLYFWKSPWYFYDAPLVELTPHYLIFINKNVSGNYQNYFTSSFSVLNSNFDNLLIRPNVQIMNVYDKELSINNKLIFTLTFEEKEGEETRNIKILMFFKYGLDSKVRLLMNSIGFIDIDTPFGFSEIKTMGELQFKQQSPIQYSQEPNKNYYYQNKEENLLGNDDFSPYDLSQILEYYQTNNYTTHYDYQYQIKPVDGKKMPTVKAEINIPKYQKILYRPSLYELIKEAWIQYMFFFVVLFFIFRTILCFLMEHKLFSCYERGELVNYL